MLGREIQVIRIRAAVIAALRSFGVAPWNTIGVCLTLAVAVGAALAVEAVWDTAIVRPLVFRDPERIVNVSVESPPGASAPSGRLGDNLMPAEVETLRRDSLVFEWIGTWAPRAYVLESGSTAAYVGAALVSPGMLETLGVAPEAGRLFAAEDHAAASAADSVFPEPAREVAIVSHDLWLTGFAGQEIGRAEVTLDRRSFRIVGVMPPEFVFPSSGIRIWLPAREAQERPAAEGAEARSATIGFPVVGRLKPDVTPAAASAETTSVVANLEQRTGEERVTIIPLQEELTGSLRPTLLVLRAGAWLLILVGAFSVSSLRFSRALAERRTAAIRRALGAGPRDELVASAVRVGAEALLIFPGAVFVALAVLSGMRGLGSDLPLAEAWRLGASSLATGFLAALLAATLVELPQLVATARAWRNSALDSARGQIVARPFAFAFLAGGTAASVVVLTGVVVLGGSVLALREGRGGYSADGLTVATVDFSGWGDGAVAPEARAALLDRSVARLRALPSVRAAAYAETMPDEQSGRGGSYVDDGRPVDFTERRVGPGFLGVLGVEPVAGRELIPSDGPSAGHVAVLDRSFARRLGDAPLDRTVRVMGGAYRVVGVVPDVLTFPMTARSPTIYTPYASPAGLSFPFPRAQIVVRTAGEPSAEVLTAVRRTVGEVDPRLRVLRVESVWRQRSRELGSPVLGSFVLVIFGAAGVLLSILGPPSNPRPLAPLPEAPGERGAAPGPPHPCAHDTAAHRCGRRRPHPGGAGRRRPSGGGPPSPQRRGAGLRGHQRRGGGGGTPSRPGGGVVTRSVQEQRAGSQRLRRTNVAPTIRQRQKSARYSSDRTNSPLYISLTITVPDGKYG